VNTQQPLIYWQHAGDGIPDYGDASDIIGAGVSTSVVFTTHHGISEAFNRWPRMYESQADYPWAPAESSEHMRLLAKVATAHVDQARLRIATGESLRRMFYDYEGGYTYKWTQKLSHPHATAKIGRTSIADPVMISRELGEREHDAAMGAIASKLRTSALAAGVRASFYHPIRLLNMVEVRDLVRGERSGKIYSFSAARTGLLSKEDDPSVLLDRRILDDALWIHAYDDPKVMARMGLTYRDTFWHQTMYQLWAYELVTGRIPDEAYICRWAEDVSVIEDAALAYASLLPDFAERNSVVPALYIATPERAIPQSEAREAIKRAADIIGSAHQPRNNQQSRGN